MPFETEMVEIRGVPNRVWKNALPNLAALVAQGRSHGEATFLVYEDERVAYDAWHRAVAAFAAHLQSLGVAKGDRVALAMRNLPEWPVIFYAVVSIGAICVPLNAWWTSPEL
ncbi:MAG: fatty acid--CoA ligase, partial [Novosphingobium sp.]|nr:fatty acid--CoA ligase [Novosphingobium sp.]